MKVIGRETIDRVIQELLIMLRNVEPDVESQMLAVGVDAEAGIDLLTGIVDSTLRDGEQANDDTVFSFEQVCRTAAFAFQVGVRLGREIR